MFIESSISSFLLKQWSRNWACREDARPGRLCSLVSTSTAEDDSTKSYLAHGALLRPRLHDVRTGYSFYFPVEFYPQWRFFTRLGSRGYFSMFIRVFALCVQFFNLIRTWVSWAWLVPKSRHFSSSHPLSVTGFFTWVCPFAFVIPKRTLLYLCIYRLQKKKTTIQECVIYEH